MLLIQLSEVQATIYEEWCEHFEARRGFLSPEDHEEAILAAQEGRWPELW